MTRTPILVATFLAVISALPTAVSADFFARGQCAVVVASRPSLGDVRAYISSENLASVARVFESRNGWFAITVKTIPNEGSSKAVAGMKQAGLVPDDAYCSTGNAYLREVSWQTSDSRSASDELWSEFDARPLTETEKRFLQAALALTGDYNGLLDGAWGSRSQKSFEAFTLREFDTDNPRNMHAAYLVSRTIDIWSRDGWDFWFVDPLVISLMLPVKGLRLVEEDGPYQKWQHATKDLEISFSDLTGADMAGLHQLVVEQTPDQSFYTLRRSDTWVTSSTAGNQIIYLRSDLLYGTWSTVGVFADQALDADMRLITGSIRKGPAPSIAPRENGVLLAHFDALRAEMARADESGTTGSSRRNGSFEAPRGSKDGQTENEASSTGTAFFVTDDGVALTNAHVVQDCRAITLADDEAEVIATSAVFDLAAIRLVERQTTMPLEFSKGDAGLNTDLTIAGYPLHGLLGGLNVSRGSVSSLKGIQGDETQVQISAPVQPGNSGGPAIDRSGGVVGVVVAKLDTVALADLTGDIAQNVNFAIRGSFAKAFLSSNGIQYVEREQEALLAPEKAAEMLATSTRLVECLP